MSEERSESGAPIYRHNDREIPWTPPDMSNNSIEAISAHIEKHIGPIKMIWHEVMSDLVHIDVHQVEPTVDRPYWTLVTSGMSDLPMAAPEGNEQWAHAELMICLPKAWKLTQEDFKDERNYWPIRWLKFLARFPHEYKTWLSWGHTMPTGNPPKPPCEGVSFDCIMLSRPRTVSTDFWRLPIRDDKVIQFFSLMPLYPGETEMKLKTGAEELERLWERHKITELLNIRRRDVSKKSWWRPWE